MSDFDLPNTDATLFQMRATSAERTLANAKSNTQGEDGCSDVDLEKASKQFESLLLNFMIREMRATVPESGLFPQSMAEDIYTSMLDEQMADVMAERGGIGISRMLIDQLNEGKTGE